MSHFSIAGIQFAPQTGDNLDAMARQCELTIARFPWVDMVLFPELAPFGPNPAAAQPLPGPAEQFFAALARKLSIWLIPGSLYELRDGKVYNTSPVINPDGEVVGRYSKLYPFTPYEVGIEGGSEFLVFDVPQVGRFGLSICYDIWFPETARSLTALGAEVILHPSLTNTADRDAEHAMIRATAAQNQCYVIDVNTCGGPLGVGRSLMVGPDGKSLHEFGELSETVPMELDLDRVRRERERGIMGLGQPLKSYRDRELVFPAYNAAAAPSEFLDSLGPLKQPAQRKAASQNLKRKAG
ncbi:carbon-nitrogen hydrolase family protein [Rhodovibrionaceae bacterium A322]